MDSKEQVWFDRLEITEVLNQLFQAVDEKNFDETTLSRIFTTEAKAVRPNGVAVVGPRSIGESQRQSFVRFRATQHLVSGQVITINGDDAEVRANLVAMHLWADGNGDPHALESYFLAGSVVQAKAEKTSSGWRISELVVRNTWRTGSGFASIVNHPYS
jgi:SnoaL-like domain